MIAIEMTVEERSTTIEIKSILEVCKEHPESESWMGDQDKFERMINLIEDMLWGEPEPIAENEKFEAFPRLSGTIKD